MDPRARDAYLELLKLCLTRALFLGEGRSRRHRRRGSAVVMESLTRRGYRIAPALPDDTSAVTRVPGLHGSWLLRAVLRRRDRCIVPDEGREAVAPPPAPSGGRLRSWGRRVTRVEREFGLDWPEHAETMIGLRRLDNVDRCVRATLEQDVAGDLAEAGVWRGGATILMRAVLAAYGDPGRRVWVADSFRGLPPPNPDAFPADEGLDFTAHRELAVGVQQVEENFARYGMLDDRVRFLVGWFKDTLPSAPVERLAVLRLDGDLYESTMDALEALYPRLSPGGFCIVDDYGAVRACRTAVDDYRALHGITEPIRSVDWTGVFWQRGTE